MCCKVLVVLVLVIVPFLSTGQIESKYFAKARPIVADSTQRAERVWSLKPISVIPAYKLLESTRDNAGIDGFFIASAGGGVAFQKSHQTDESKNYVDLSISPFTLLFSGDTSQEGAAIDVSYLATVGLLNNVIQLGLGVDFGESDSDRSRVFGMVSFGVNITNN